MRTRIFAAAAVAACLVLAGCAGTPPAQSDTAAKVFTYASNYPIMTSWDPATSHDVELVALNNVYETLTRYNSTTGEVDPLLATSWTTSEDGLTWTFTLRDDVTFSTGRPMDAAAAKEALDRTIELGGGTAYNWDAVDSISAPDATTLVFHLKYAAPLDLIASAQYSAYVYDTKAASGDLAAWFEAGNTAGTGPYVVDSYKKGQENELTLKANPSYWGGWSGDRFTQVAFRIVPEETTAAQLLESGEVTFVQRLSAPLFASMAGKEGVATSESTSFQNIMPMFNTASGPLADVQVRRAIAQAIDYDGIVQGLKGALVKSQGVIPEGLLGYTTEVSPTTDIENAKALLAAAGYGPGGKELHLTLTYPTDDAMLETVVTLMKSNLAAVGVTLDAKPLAWTTQWDIGKSSDVSKRQDIFLFYWWPEYADPYSWFVNLYRSADPVVWNLSYWNDPAMDEVIDGLQALTATDRAKADQQYVDLQKTVSDQAISPPLGVVVYQRALSSSVEGYVDNPAYTGVVFVHDLTVRS